MAVTHTHDHEIKIGSTTKQLDLVIDDNGRKMYSVTEDVPKFQDPLEFIQTDWIGGHGQYAEDMLDKYFEGQSIDTTVPGKVCLGPLIQEVQEDDATALDGNVVGFCWFPAITKLLCWTATNIYRLDSDGWDLCATTVTGVLNMAVFGTTIFAARGATGAYVYSTDGDTWTTCTLADTVSYRFLVSPSPTGATDILWKFATPNEVKNNTSGINGGAAWSSANYISDTANNITNIFLSSDNLLIGKVDGLFQLDGSGGVHPLRPDLLANRSTDNFKYVASWQTGVYHSEINGMGEITANHAYEPMGPLTGIDDIGRRGDIVGISSDKDWLYVAIDEGTNTIIYKGREVRKDNKLRWEWCPFVFVGTNACASILVSQHSTTDRRLWFGYGTKTAYVVLSDNPLADSLYRYCASGYMRMSYTYGSNANWDKLWQSAVLEVSRVNSGAITAASSGETVQVQYLDDTDTSATSIISAATTVGVYETNFSSALNNKRIQFQLNLASDTNTATPVVTFFQAKGIEKPTTVRVHEATYQIGDDFSNRAKTIKEFLEGGRTSTSLIKFADLRLGQKTTGTASGDYVWVVMEPGFPKILEIDHGKSKQPEMAIQCRFKEVSFTIS